VIVIVVPAFHHVYHGQLPLGQVGGGIRDPHSAGVLSGAKKKMKRIAKAFKLSSSGVSMLDTFKYGACLTTIDTFLAKTV
jgi:hypothetical protein